MVENHQLVPNATKLGLKRINQHRNSKGTHWKEAAGTGVAESRGDDFFIPEGINGSRGGTPCKKNQVGPPWIVHPSLKVSCTMGWKHQPFM